ncbi:MAG TPA: glycosyl hydrolase family 8 [Candidatus Paceibacterota bacterium]|jgi:endoglucanase|nr:glycosyl hydrolase family 8 [Candidatus Paceibacterota bacterium]
MPTTVSTSFNYDYYPSNALTHGTFVTLIVIAAAVLVAGILLLILGTARNHFLAKIFGVIFLALGGVTLLGTWYYQKNSQTLSEPVFSNKTMLASLWENYKGSYIDPSSGRTFDTERSNDSTSEGEGYTMLRAVWMDDEPTFDASWKWTQTNLQRSDNLFSWLWGPSTTAGNGGGNTTGGVIVAQNGENSASDADTDIALSLIFAYARWQNPAYLEAAIPIVKSIWANEVFIANNEPYLAPNNLTSAEKTQEMQPIDPSYFAPYAYRIFAQVDPSDDWNGLINTSYQVLDNSIALPLDASTSATSADLPPDWVVMDTTTGSLSAPAASSGEDTNFGYDALRVPFRIALDWEWNKDPRAEAVLQKLHFLTDQWDKQQILDAVYAHDGTPVPPLYQDPAVYGGTIGYFMVADPADSNTVYTEKLQSLYDPDTQTWRLPLSYYDSNIAWFGMALYNNDLPNLFALNFSQ